GGPGNPGFRPPVAGPSGPGGPGAFRPPPGSGGRGSEDGGMRPPGPGGMGAFRPGGSGSGAATDGSGDINIVELNLYGVASLFEKPGVPPIAPPADASK
ncbi:MAG: phosphopeptide-binding protein, partial [Planctomycetaceae bacterium]